MYKAHAQLTEEHPLFAATLAHRNDPKTSFDAAKTLVASGELTKQETQVWNWGIRHQTTAGITAKELASKLHNKHYGDYHFLYHRISRRISGLKNKDRVEEFKVGGKQFVRDGCGVWRFV